MSLPFEDAGLPFEEALPFETGDALPPIISEAEAAKYAAARAVKGEEIKSTGIPEVDKHRRNLIGRTEAGASLVSGLAGLTAGLIGGPIKSAITGQPLEKSISDISEPLTYQPRTEAGQESLKPAGEFINRYMNPLLGHMNINMSGRPKKGKPAPPVRDMDAVIMEQKAVTETPVKPIPTEAQMELPDAAMIRAPQYGVMEGMGRIDENGIPIKADVSMEARNLENPLQRNLWGDELPPKSPQEAPMGITAAMDTMQPGMRSGAIFREGLQEPLKAPESLTKAMDEATVPMRPKEGPFSLPDEPVNMGRGMGRSQSGAMNMAVLDPLFEKVKQISDNIRLVMKGSEEGPRITAFNRVGEKVGEVAFGPKEWASPTPKSNLVASFVRSEHPGLAKEMYKFAAEQKNDIEASPAQTAAGRHMWEKFNKEGLAEGKVIPAQSAKDLTAMARDLEILNSLPGTEQHLLNVTADRINHGMAGRQRGAMMIPGKKPPKVDTVDKPSSPEMIAKKQELANKAAALKLKDSPYEQVKTVEEAKADPGPDLTNNQVRNLVSSGIAGQIYRNSKNKLLKLTRHLFDESKEAQEAFSTKYVTGPTGFNKAYRTLSKEEWAPVAEALQAGSRTKTELTPELLTKLGLNEKQQAVFAKAREAANALFELANKSLEQQGLKPLDYHPGYMPSMFSGAYTHLIKKGNRMIAPVMADTAYGLKKGVEFFQDKIDSGEYQVVKLERRGLNTTVGYNRVFSGFNDLISSMAKLDPEFAALKKQVDDHISQSVKHLYNFDVHEKRKTGVKGALGDRPWLDQQTNAKQFLEGLVDYLESGSDYYTKQSALADVYKITSDPELMASHPNTLHYMDQYAKAQAGHNLSVLGAALNATIDLPFKMAGIGPNVPKTLAAEVRNWSSMHMMGVFNPGFLGTQLTQYWTGGFPEAMSIKQTLGLSPVDLVTSWGNMTKQFGYIGTEVATGKKLSVVDPHMREAFNWAKEQGMLHLSEAQLAKSVLEPVAYKRAKEIGNLWTTVGEAATRPAIFLWYTDLFHKAGITPDQGLYRIAKGATDYAMVNYHSSERPMIYSSLGYMGEFVGGLTRFKHNLIEQWYTRSMNASPIKLRDAETNKFSPGLKAPKQVGSIAAMLGMAYFFQGLLGLPGAQEADQVYQEVTGKTIREAFGENAEQSAYLNGVLSAYTGLDFQSRMSMANVIPDNPVAGLAGPYLSNAANIMAKGITYAIEQDKASRNQFFQAATPLGLRGFLEEGMMTNEEGYILDKEGQRKYNQPRGVNEKGIDERTWRKWMGVRPLRERIEDEDLYADDQAYKKMTTNQREAMKKLRAAINLKDSAGADQAIADYQEAGGDPNNLKPNIKKIIQEKNLTARQRRVIAPKNSVGSMNKYREYSD